MPSSNVINHTDIYERRMNDGFTKGSVRMDHNWRNRNRKKTMMLITLIFLIGLAMMGASINAMMKEQRIIDRQKQFSNQIARFGGR
jgi:hypothetical protein